MKVTEHELHAYVDERLEKARQSLGETDRFRAAVLASLQVAGELWDARKEVLDARRELQETKRRLSGLLGRLEEER